MTQTIVKVFPEEVVCNYLDKFDNCNYPSSFKKHFLIDAIKRNSYIKRNNFLDHIYRYQAEKTQPSSGVEMNRPKYF